MKPIELHDLICGACNIAIAGAQARAMPLALTGQEELLRQMDKTGQLVAMLKESNVSKSLEEVTQPVVIKTLRSAVVGLGCVDLPHRFRRKLDRIIEYAERKPFDPEAVYARSEELVQDLMAEVFDPVFLYVSADKAHLYTQKEPAFGKEVADAFPDSNKDIAAATRCLALDEWTACVFHCMRVLEQGLHVFAAEMKVTFPAGIELENWKNIIDKIEVEIRKLETMTKGQEKSKKTQRCSEAASQFRYFKDAWRNHCAHAREYYDERDATTVWTHVRDFMQAMVEFAPASASGSASA